MNRVTRAFVSFFLIFALISSSVTAKRPLFTEDQEALTGQVRPANKGDVARTLKDLTSTRNIKSLAATVATAGIVHGVSHALELPAQPKELSEHFHRAVLKTGVSTTLETTIGGQSFKEAGRFGLRTIAAQTAGGYMAGEIGEAYSAQNIDYMIHKLSHFGVGALVGATVSKDPAKGLLAGGTGGVLGETFAEAFKDHLLESKEILSETDINWCADMGRLGAVTVSVLAQQDPHTALFAADNAVDNNFSVSAMKTLIQQILKKLFAKEAVKKTGKEGAKGVKKGATETGKKTEPGKKSAKNVALHEQYKAQLRRDMKKPPIEDPSLAKIVERLYRPHASIGNGSTSAALRYEKATGFSVEGRFHEQKAFDSIQAVEKWMKNNLTALPGDRAAAENIIKDLKDALH